MTESVLHDSPLKPLPDRVMVARQLASTGAKTLAGIKPSLQNGEDVLGRQARECGFESAAQDDIGPGRQLLPLYIRPIAGNGATSETNSLSNPAIHRLPSLKDSTNREKGK
jgi:hypothetical protein